MPRVRTFHSALLLLLLLLASFFVGYQLGIRGDAASPEPAITGLLWPGPPRLSAFHLRNQDDHHFTEDSLRNQWTLLFFGYTHCPDICPTTLDLLKRTRTALQDIPELAGALKVLFVSVDAQRDTPEVLSRYVRYFDPDFQAATAPMEELHLLTRQLAADFAKFSEGNADEYWFDHSASIFLVAPDLRIVGEFLPPLDAERLATQVRGIYQFINRHG